MAGMTGMELGLSGKSVAVMGASSGLGRAVALEFAKANANVTLFARRETELMEVAEQVVKYGVACRIVAGDMTHIEDIIEFAHVAKDNGDGYIDALFLNGGGPTPGKFADFNDKDWSDAYRLTLMAYVRTIRACLPAMPSGDGDGAILANTSSSVKVPMDGMVLSNTFRLGIIGLVKSLAVELAPNVRVNAIAPGRITTDRTIELGGGIDESTMAKIPMRRYGVVSEFARVAVFYCSQASSYITGQTVIVDGGYTKAI
jgi:3-oxoacyl-[acyl-carrier protein] reductase